MSLEIKFDTGDLEAALERIPREFQKSMGQAVREEAEILMTQAKERTPVDTGTLRASGRVEGPDFDTGAGTVDVVVTLSFGGAASEYAIYVHENLTARHTNGQAKFLESVLIEAAPTLASKIAARLKGTF